MDRKGQNMRLFVYGTLKKGGGLHYLIENCLFVEMMGIRDYKLISLGGFPGLVPSNGDITTGEIYEINDPGLQKTLDRIEIMYNRTRIFDFECYVLKPECFFLEKEDLGKIKITSVHLGTKYYEWIN